MSYEPYEPGTTMRTAVAGGDDPRSRSRSSSGRTIGAVAGAAIAVVGGLVAITSGEADSVPVEQDRYAACAAAHDETGSLFSDAEWCDLELNGGNGDGTFDEVPDGVEDLPRPGGYYP